MSVMANNEAVADDRMTDVEPVNAIAVPTKSTITAGYIDMVRLIAGRLILTGWLLSPTAPVSCRIRTTGGLLRTTPIVGVSWYDRPDIAVTIDTGDRGDRVAFVMAVNATILHGVADWQQTVDLALLDESDVPIIEQAVSIGPITMAGNTIDPTEIWTIDIAMDGGLIDPLMRPVLHALAVSQGDASGIGHVDFGTRMGPGLIINGWMPNAGERHFVMLTDGLESLISSDEMALFQRSDVSEAIAGWGGRAITDQHGFVTTVPIALPTTSAIHIFEILADQVQHRGTLHWTHNEDVETAMSAFLVHFGKGRLPMPKVAARHLGPLLRGAIPTERRFDTLVGRPVTDPVTLSVVVPLHGRPLLFRSLLQNQNRYPDGTEFIYVCDDPDLVDFATSHLLDRRSQLVHPSMLVINRRNMGYSIANNIGVSQSSGDVILFQNSDIWVDDPAGLAIGMAALDEGKHGIIGFRLFYEDGTLQHDGITFQKNAGFHGLHVAEHRGKGLPAPTAPIAATVDAVTGAMLMIRRDWFDEIGGFDPDYVRGDFEDADLCLRSAQRGKSVGIVRAGRIFHLERQSIGQTGTEASRVLITYVNGIHFNQQWAAMLDRKAH